MRLGHGIVNLGLGVCAIALVACSDDSPGNGGDATSDATADGTDATDATDASDGTDATGPDGTDATDATDTSDGEVTQPTSCDDPIPAPADGELCSVTAGSNSVLYIRANLIMPEGLVERGGLVIENGLITCAGCDCGSAPNVSGATVFACPDAVVSPGLVNGHDHIGYSQGKPQTHGDVRYDHRNEWRSSGGVTVPGKPKIPGPQNDSALGDSWAELRQVLAGTTSYFASGAAPGLARNLDTASRLENLEHGAATYDTFPLGTTGVIESGCGYDEKPSPTVLNAVAWVPHVAEGVNQGARNEELCLDGQEAGGVDVVEDNTGFIHAVGTTAADIAVFVGDGAGLVWSPRTNTDLYGFTAFAPIFHRLGGQIALGTDWTYSGSVNMLRELQCAEDWNARWDHYFSDAQLVAMATTWGAQVLGFGDVLGSLTVGKIGDVVIWDAREHEGYRAVLDADVQDIALVLRGGTPPSIAGTTYFRRGRPLYGEPNLVAALSDRQLDYSKYDPNVYSATDATKKKLAACETIDICGVEKSLCLAEQMEEKPSGATYNQTYTYAELKAQLDPAKTYDAFFCGAPPTEPTCVPSRPGEFTGVPSASDPDGDGIPDGEDNCPTWFNAIRPMDGGHQPDTDGDREGDVCDPCPFDADTTACTSIDPDDIDGDGFVNDSDKCPSTPDDQADSDADGIGNACDDCPDFPNVGGKGCPTTISAIKKGEVAGGKPVTLEGVVVVSVGPDFYTVQTPGTAAEYSGLYVFTGATGNKPAAGALVDVAGTISDYFGQTQLSGASFTVLPEAGVMPPAAVVAPADIAKGGPKEKAFEAQLVELHDVTVTDTTPTASTNGNSTEDVAGEFEVTGGVRVDDAIFAVPDVAEGVAFPVLRGVLRYSWSRDKLMPRSAADVTSGPPRLSGFGAAALTMYAGATRTVEVTLTGNAQGAVTVTLASDATGVATVPASVVIPNGARTANVTVTGVGAGDATITASYDGVDQALDVKVLAANAQPKVVALEAESDTVVIGSTVVLMVTLDLPGKPGGTPVAISASGSPGATVPAQVVVADGDNTAEVEVTVGASAGSATITASAGGAQKSVTLTIVERPVVGLILAEVFYNPSGSDDGQEWVKLFNGSTSAIDLSAYSLSWRGTDLGQTGGVVQLVGSVPAGACFIVGGPTANSGITSFGQPYNFEPDIQNGGTAADEALDGVSLYRMAEASVTTTSVPIDVVAWGVVNKNHLLGPDGQDLAAANAPVVNGKSVRRVSLTTWEEATPSSDCITLVP